MLELRGRLRAGGVSPDLKGCIVFTIEREPKTLCNIIAERGSEKCGNETMVYTTVKWAFSSASRQQA